MYRMYTFAVAPSLHARPDVALQLLDGEQGAGGDRRPRLRHLRRGSGARRWAKQAVQVHGLRGPRRGRPREWRLRLWAKPGRHDRRRLQRRPNHVLNNVHART